GGLITSGIGRYPPQGTRGNQLGHDPGYGLTLVHRLSQSRSQSGKLSLDLIDLYVSLPLSPGTLKELRPTRAAYSIAPHPSSRLRPIHLFSTIPRTSLRGSDSSRGQKSPPCLPKDRS